jgi:ABC-type branched-subunit amino acid transport system substrate-binding protein
MKIVTKALIVVGMISLTTSCSLLSGTDSKKTGGTVVAMLPLTGDLAFLGDPGKAALNLVKTQGKDNGLSFTTVDTKANPKETVTLMRREKDVNGRNLFITTLSAPSLAAKESFAKEDVAMISISIYPDLPSANAPMVRFCISANQEAEMLVSRIGKDKKSIGLVVSRDAATTAEVEKHIIPALKKAGKEIKFIEQFDVGNKDFKNLAAKYKDKKPQELLVLGYGSDFPAALNAIVTGGSTDGLTVYGGIGFVELSERPKGFDKAKFNIAVPAFAVETVNPKATEFRAAYKKATGKNASYDAAFTYDAATVLGKLYSEGKTKPQEVLAGLRNQTFDGVVGKISIDANGESTTEMKWADFDAKQLKEIK